MLTERNGSTLTVVLSRERPQNYFALLSEELVSYKGQGIKKIIFDATELMYLKGEGVSHVVSACREMGSKPEVVFVNCPQEIQDMLGRVGLGTIIKFETNQEIIDSVREKRFHNLKEEAIQKINERRHKLLEDFAAKNDVVCYTMRLGQDEYLYHSVEHFNIFTQETIVYPLSSDQTVADVLAWLLSGKMYGIFAMLFGLSFFIMNDNQAQKGRSFSGRFAWRMCLLFLFGVVNVAFYDGDILMLYAVYGLFLIPVSYLSSGLVWLIIGLLVIQPVELYCLLTGYEIDHTRFWEVSGMINAAHEHGTFWENTLTNLRYGFEVNLRFNIFSGRLTQLLCLFIIGMQLGRQRLFYNEGNHLKIWHNVLWISALVVIIMSLVDFSPIALWLTPIYNFIILLMIVSAVVSGWYAFEGVRRVLHHLCIFGRMSLTNYLLQSIWGAIVCWVSPMP